MMKERTFGEIAGYSESTSFVSRKELSDSGVHRPTQAGISGSEADGADSIVLSGGYEDDEDFGDIIIYTGHGGRDPVTGHQIANQTLTRQNLALAKNKVIGLPVRVIRGAQHKSSFSPTQGYRYDGLYRVDDYWHEVGRSGHIIWRFRLVKLQPDIDSDAPSTQPYQSTVRPQKRETVILRIVRDTKKAKEVKSLYDYTCQICGIRLESSAGPYAEAAHIRPLGAPHNGPDIIENMLCLCPNHHVLLDLGAISIEDDLSLLGIDGELAMHRYHSLDSSYLKYHRDHYSSDNRD